MKIQVSRFYELATRSGLPTEQRDSGWDGQETSSINVGDGDRQVISVDGVQSLGSIDGAIHGR